MVAECNWSQVYPTVKVGADMLLFALMTNLILLTAAGFCL
jgi:hypothetical protein